MTPHTVERLWIFLAGVSVTFGSASAQLTFSDDTDNCGLIAAHDPFPVQDCLIWACGYLLPDMGSGGVAGDFNNDGWQDVFIVVGGNAPDLLFINTGTGAFTEQGAAWGVGVVHRGAGAATGDYNGDGWLDIYVTSWGPPKNPVLTGQHKLYRNNGDGTFTDVAVEAGVNQASQLPDGLGAAFGDYDLDGDLDLFVCGWRAGAGGNRLFRNEGDGTFSDVTDTAIPETVVGIRGFAPRFVDMNGDRHPELLIAADFGTSRYLVNNLDGTFTDYTVESGTGIDANGMGQDIGDFDGDLLLDWYVTSIHNDENAERTGNMLYMNQGDHQYLGDEASSILAGVNDGGWGWGAVAVDLDHDLDSDLVETNGWPLDLYIGELSKVFLNDGTGVFSESALAVGIDHDLSGRGVINLDYDNDGDQDLIFIPSEDVVKVYRNDLDHTDANWLRIFFDTSAHRHLAPDGFGTRVVATAGGVARVRVMSGGDNYLSHSELSVHFGLGAATQVETLRVEWANGLVTSLTGLAANQTLVVSAPALGDLNTDGSVGTADLLALLSAWGRCPAPPEPCTADLDLDGAVSTSDLLALLSAWG